MSGDLGCQFVAEPGLRALFHQGGDERSDPAGVKGVILFGHYPRDTSTVGIREAPGQPFNDLVDGRLFLFISAVHRLSVRHGNGTVNGQPGSPPTFHVWTATVSILSVNA